MGGQVARLVLPLHGGDHDGDEARNVHLEEEEGPEPVDLFLLLGRLRLRVKSSIKHLQQNAFEHEKPPRVPEQ